MSETLILPSIRADLMALALVLQDRAAAANPLDCIELYAVGTMLISLAQGKSALASRPHYVTIRGGGA